MPHNITTIAHGQTLEIRPDGKHAREVIIEDELELRAFPMITSVVLLEQPGGTPATIEGTKIRFFETGRHLFKVTFSDGKSAHLRVCACTLACLDRIPNEGHDRHLPPRTFADKTSVLRSLVNEAPNFCGTPESMSFDSIGSLAQFGA
jgi:hypothetical protein